MEKLKYYYVVLGSNWDLYVHSYKDLEKIDNAEYISDDFIMNNKILRVLMSDKLKVNILKPFSQYISNYLNSKVITPDIPICFVFFSNWVRYSNKTGFIDLLKREHPNSKYVWFLQDLYQFVPYPTKYFDLILSFDKGDSNKYGYVYHPLVYSRPKEDRVFEQKSDIYFLGKAKNRLSEIYSTYELLRGEGLKIDMNLVGVPIAERKYTDDINYISSMPYAENLQHLKESKCILEIMQHGGTGYTLRYQEAVAMGKKLLTNNKFVMESPFYNERFVSFFDNPSRIDKDFVKRLKMVEDIDYNYHDDFSPIQLIQFVDNLL
jgi:hypothetical protein